ncbi:MAG: hypothetical protein HYY25_04235 [Candidatus Wallbacteria bacterium]|nr:hypothetical protein [Candidatus Wallbacteria bacterium]
MAAAMGRHDGKALLAALALAAAPVAADSEELTRLATRCEGQRFMVDYSSPQGRVRLFTDTGGGNVIYEDAVRRLGLAVRRSGAGGLPAARVPRPNGAVPLPMPMPDGCPEGGMLFVSRREMPDSDGRAGVLGEAWFKNRVWLLDYPGRQLYLVNDARAFEGVPKHPLFFQTDPSGRRAVNYPRIEVEIDGTLYPLLLDTGATLQLTSEAAATLGRRPGSQLATSFVAGSVFDSWRRSHPDWPLIERADGLVGDQPAIRVPWVRVAGRRIGPLWFTRRPDASFHDFMSRYMDRRIDGALGGNAFASFSLLLNYPDASFALLPGSAARRRKPGTHDLF